MDVFTVYNKQGSKPPKASEFDLLCELMYSNSKLFPYTVPWPHAG